MSSLFISRKEEFSGTIDKVPSSKSISNRALIINALSGNRSVVSNLASARDTQLMKKLLASKDQTLDAMDAGTTMRFLTAYLAVTNQSKTLTGTARMKERPIGLLVEALKKVGANINYLEKEGFPPLDIKAFDGQKSDQISLPGNVSSQYISAMMMVAPVLPMGLTIRLEGKVGSKPYIQMTASQMAQFGVECQFDGNSIIIPHAHYKSAEVRVEPDWSALSYWFAFVTLANKSTLTLKGVPPQSIQGDRVIVEIMAKLGVEATFKSNDLILTKTGFREESIEWDFTDCPDLAQTVLPVCALTNVSGSFTGLESLYIKETDRVTALQNELAKVDATLQESTTGHFKLFPGKIPSGRIHISTYHDHRMAMGFAPWATLTDLEIESPEVVNKSYPEFWDDMRNVGFELRQV